MPRHEVTIRRATNDEIGAINAQMQKSSAYQGQYRSILEGYELTSAQIERDHVCVAEEQAKVLGFYSLIASSADHELDLLFVSDTARQESAKITSGQEAKFVVMKSSRVSCRCRLAVG
jgi:hypothetical protein